MSLSPSLFSWYFHIWYIHRQVWVWVHLCCLPAGPSWGAPPASPGPLWCCGPPARTAASPSPAGPSSAWHTRTQRSPAGRSVAADHALWLDTATWWEAQIRKDPGTNNCSPRNMQLQTLTKAIAGVMMKLIIYLVCLQYFTQICKSHFQTTMKKYQKKLS